MDKQLSPQFLRQRQFLLVAPLLVLPFLVMLFWALGGGKGTAKAASPQANKGFNTTLPNAHLKDNRAENKMAYYEQAAIDSTKLAERLKNDAYYADRIGAGDTSPATHLPVTRDANEQKVYDKLNQLNEALNKATGKVPDTIPAAQTPSVKGVSTEDIDRLEKMIHVAKGSTEEADPQMVEMNRLLDKLMAVQHPELVKDTMRQQPGKTVRTGLTVSASPQDSAVTGHRFHILGGDALSSKDNTMAAIIPETQTLVNGATVKLELASDLYIAGAKVPKGTFIYGTAALNNERLVIAISTIRNGNNIYPVSLVTYDQDGMAGIYMPGSITRDVAKQSADEGLNSMGVASLDPSLGAQAAAAGIQLAKSVISKKVKLVRVTVPSGYRVLLKDTNQH